MLKFTSLFLWFFALLVLTETSESQPYSFTVLGKKYDLEKISMVWADAAAYAKEKGGYLTHIGSKEEQKGIYDAIKVSGVPTDYVTVMDGGGVAYIWIGATDQGTEGTWLWDGDNDGKGTNFWNGQGASGANNGKAVNNAYVNWGGTSYGKFMEPDDYVKSQDAAAIALAPWPKGIGSLGIAGEWNDIKVSNGLYFIIEYDNETESPSPSKPDSGSANLDLKPKFIWGKEDCDSYHLQVSKKIDFSSDNVIDKSDIKDTFYISLSNLDYGTKYYWRVSATKDDVVSKWSFVWYFTTKEADTPPPPVLIEPADKSDNISEKPVYKWIDDGADSYKLQVSANFDFSDNITDKSLPDTSYKSENALEYGEKYFWRVQAVKHSKSSEWSEPWQFTVKLVPPQSVPLISPANNSQNVELNPVFKFLQVKYGKNYKLTVSENNDLSSPIIENTFEPDYGEDSIVAGKELDEGTTYYWQIIASNSAGNGIAGEIWRFTTKTTVNSVENDLVHDGLRINPNPAYDLVDIVIPPSELSHKVQIFALTGLLIRELPYSNRIDISDLTVGVYLIKIGPYSSVFFKI